MNTIRPKPRSAMPGAIAWASHADSTLTAWTRRGVHRIQVGQRRPVERGGRVNEHVAASVQAEHTGRGGPDRIGLGEVHGRIAVPVEDHDLVPGCAQARGDRTADGPGSPGDRCHARHGPHATPSGGRCS